MSTDKTALTAAKDFLKGKTMRVSNANLKEPPGGTYRAVHENEVADLLKEFSYQENKELIEENERLKSLQETMVSRGMDIERFNHESFSLISDLRDQLQESQQMNERLVSELQLCFDKAEDRLLTHQTKRVAELLSSTKEKGETEFCDCLCPNRSSEKPKLCTACDKEIVDPF